MRKQSWSIILGFSGLVGCGQITSPADPQSEAAVQQTQSALTATPAVVAVPKAIVASEADVAAHGPPEWARDRKKPPAGTPVADDETTTEVR